MSRSPTEMQTTRMGRLSRLPAFFALESKRAVVAGGSAGGGLESRTAFGRRRARSRCLRPGTGRGHAERSRRRRRAAPSLLHERAWRAADLAGAAIAVAECADDDEAAHFAAAARAAGVPVNVIDRPAFCDFSFGAIVNRSPLVIGISTDGASPVFGQAIRAKIEALIPKGFARWADAARTWRPRVQALALPFRGRRNVLGEIRRAGGRRAEQPRRRIPIFDGAAYAGRGGASRLRYSGRRRPGRSGAVDAARGARAAIGRRDFVRRSGVARTFSISRAAKQRKCWSARPATRRRASRTTSTC